MNFTQKDKWDAQHYKKNSAVQFQGAMVEIQKIKFRGDEQVIDVGCGDGKITFEIAKLVPNGSVLGIDLSKNMINEAKKDFGDIKNLSFQNEDVTKFISDKKFDLVVSFSAFHWIKEQKSALDSIFNFLKPGGKLIIRMGAHHDNPIARVYSSSKWSLFLKNRPQTFFPQTVENVSDMLEKSGFKNIDVKFGIAKKLFEKKEDFFNVAYAWVPASTGLQGEQAREFTQDLVGAFAAHSSSGDSLVYETPFLNIKAEKSC